jgi:uncharacterized protein (TIGR03086 family)
MTMEPLDQLALALDETAQMIASIRDDEWTNATPCTEWTVRDLVAHVEGGNRAFTRILRGEPAGAGAAAQPGAAEDRDRPARFQESATALLAAFRQPGVLEQVFTVPFGSVPGIVALHLRLTEILVHGWDLAQATARRTPYPEDLAEQELAFSAPKLNELPAGRSPFAPPRPVAADAPAIDRLAALLGREIMRAPTQEASES